MANDVEHLVEILDLEPIEMNIFRGVSPPWQRLPRVFGGQVAAQALMAAGRTVEVGRVHSLHAYFLKGGDPRLPILYEVDRIRNGRSFTTRRVVAIQKGEAILNLDASFHVAEEGVAHQDQMPPAPSPDELPTLLERLRPYAGEAAEFLARPHPIDQRFVGELPWVRTEAPRPGCQQLWIRADGELTDDPLLHACVITYASDMSLFDSMLLPHNLRWDDAGFMGASLDHCMWFHRPVRADGWTFFDQKSPVAYGARGLSTGRMFDAGGNLVISLVQEGLMRVKRERS